jgi:hypothetical protein
MTTECIDVSESLALTHVAQSMIKSLWEIPRARYTHSPPPPALFAPADFTPDRFRTPDRSPAKRLRIALGIQTRDRL